jgi:hypothetical protein
VAVSTACTPLAPREKDDGHSCQTLFCRLCMHSIDRRVSERLAAQRDRPSLIESFSPLASLPSRAPIPALKHTHTTRTHHSMPSPAQPPAQAFRSVVISSCNEGRKVCHDEKTRSSTARWLSHRGPPTHPTCPRTCCRTFRGPAALLGTRNTERERRNGKKKRRRKKKTNGSNGGPFLRTPRAVPVS